MHHASCPDGARGSSQQSSTAIVVKEVSHGSPSGERSRTLEAARSVSGGGGVSAESDMMGDCPQFEPGATSRGLFFNICDAPNSVAR